MRPTEVPISSLKDGAPIVYRKYDNDQDDWSYREIWGIKREKSGQYFIETITGGAVKDGEIIRAYSTIPKTRLLKVDKDTMVIRSH